MFLPQNKTFRSAFTLIELLVVIGVVAVIAGALGVAMNGFGGRAKAQNAQGALISALNSVRAKAAVRQSTAYLLLNADPDDSDRYLRELIPVVADAGSWDVIGDSILLPQGVFVIPPNLNSTFPAKFDSSVSNASDWAKIQSFASSGTPSSAAIKSADGNLTLKTIKVFELVQFDKLGRFIRNTTLPNSQTTTIVVAPGEPSPGNGVTFRNHEAAAGVWLSRYGVLLPVNEKSGFDYNAADYDNR